jgi:hypothetical protein
VTSKRIAAARMRSGTNLSTLLPWFAVALLPLAWWASQQLLLDTSVLDLTILKVGILGTGIVCALTWPWPRLTRSDLVGLSIAIYVGWLGLAALLRGSGADLKLAAGYAVYFGVTLVATWVAARRTPELMARLLIGLMIVAVVLSVAGALLERVTYPAPGQVDQLRPLWEWFRPQAPYTDPVMGVIQAQPIHFPSGDALIPRLASWFPHPNLLAFFLILATPLLSHLLIQDVLRRRWLRAIVTAAGLAAVTITVLWTYSRTGLVGVFLAAAAAATVALLITRPRTRRAWGAALLPAVIVIGIGATVTLTDQIGIRRLNSLADVVTSPDVTPGQGQTVEESAARATSIRLRMQSNALEMILASPADAIVGPGQRRFEEAIHEPTSDRYIAEAAGIRDPNSLWLTVGISGGLVGIAALAAVLILIELGLFRQLSRDPTGPLGVVMAWFATWIPIYAVTQLFGPFPFSTSEAAILATVLGTSLGLIGVRRERPAEPV